jgi:cysteine desulfurase
MVQALRASESRRLTDLRDAAIRRLTSAIPGITLNGDPKRRLPNNINLTIPGAEGTALVLYLDQAGIMAATGAACSSNDLEPSHVLTSLGRTRAESASSLRLTLGRGTIPEHIDKLVEELPRIVSRLRKLG